MRLGLVFVWVERSGDVGLAGKLGAHPERAHKSNQEMSVPESEGLRSPQEEPFKPSPAGGEESPEGLHGNYAYLWHGDGQPVVLGLSGTGHGYSLF